ncbi:TonB-dependent siderophore receptor [Bacteriovorax sp. Seq25_V]|uniref:TonB-dependent receptor plug domain-containing protein n=1 Tax=Bacteriovorax sp. Seq25_V TaxID=1201288 RepID=UPI00038A397A|nr:TonB-dependent receptor [Bacteriovorax sp. Seq25_V]EQC45695.1 TonB-dependent receptor plug domain protein [Bacteriovorax sp. Seq25_V]
MNHRFIFTTILLAQVTYSSEVIVTADKISKKINDSTNSVTIIDAESIANSPANTIEEILQSTPGIYISTNGSLGGISVLRMRGTGRGFSKVIIDGLELNDPTDIDNSFQLNQLSLDNIASIEILRGSQSTVYGSDAIGGVIKITTKSGKLPTTKLRVGYGSYDSKSIDYSVIGTSQNGINYSFSTSYFDTDGLSKYNGKLAETDRFNKLNIKGLVSKKFKSSKVSYQFHATKSDTEIDDSTGDLADKDNASYDQDIHQLSIENRLFNDLLLSKTSFKFMEINRDSAGSYPSKTLGKEKAISWQGSLFIGPTFTSVIGVEYNDQQADNQYDFSNTTRRSIRNTSFFISSNYIKDNYSADLAVRTDHNSVFDNYETWKIGGAYEVFSGLRIKTNLATGYKAPTIYQTYAGSQNRDLKPTESFYYDFIISMEKSIFNIDLTYFNYDFKNQITYKTNRYENINKSEIKGLETELKIKPTKDFIFGSAVTIQRAINKETTKYLEKTPRLLVKSFLQIDSLISTNLEFTYVGRRNDSGALPSYYLVNTSFHYENLKVSINNLLDRDYEDTRNYTTPGRNIFASYQFEL